MSEQDTTLAPTQELELPSQPQEQPLEKPSLESAETQPHTKSEQPDAEPAQAQPEQPDAEPAEAQPDTKSEQPDPEPAQAQPEQPDTKTQAEETQSSPNANPEAEQTPHSEIPSEPTHETEKPSTEEESPKTGETETPSSTEPKKIYGGILSEDQLLEAMYLATVYREFWASKKFREGWEQPVVDLKSVEHLLEEAAEIVTELRGDHNSGSTPIDGSAKEYLWSLESLPKPDEFVRGLIHATLKHADGYVQDLNEETVDRQIAELIRSNKFHQDPATGPHPLVEVLTKGRELESTIKGQWEEVSQLLKKSLEENPTQLWTSSLVSELSHISEAIKRVQGQIETFEARKNFKTSGGLSENCHFQAETPKTNLRSSQSIPDEEIQKRILKVEMVRQKVTEMNSEINTFEEGVKSANVQELARKPIEAKTHINDMKKKAAVYLDSLLKDLDSLDAVQGDAVRPLRKAEVLHVQEIINHVEKVQEQIHRLETDLKPAFEKAQAEAAEAALKAEKEKRDAEEKARLEQESKAAEVEKVLQARRQELQRHNARLEEERRKASLERQRREIEQQKALAEQRAAEKPSESAVVPISKTVTVPVSSDSEDEDQVDWEASWRKMKLEVDLNIRELEDSYVIVGNIPNMNKKDIKIKINEDKLEVSGFRGPTEDEIAHLQRILQSRDLRGLPSRERTMALLRIGHGRFGTWSHVYQLPENVVPDEILAEYTHGILKVTLPKRRVLRRPQQSRSARPGFPYFDESPPSTRRSDPRSIYGQDPRFMYGGYPQQQQRRGHPGFGGFW